MMASHTRFSRPLSFLLLLVAYVSAFAVAVVVVAFLGVGRPIAVAFVADVAATLAVFAFSRALDNSSVYDPYWSVAPLVIGWFWVEAAAGPPGSGFRDGLVLLLVAIWGARLTFNFARGWPGLQHEDWRYVDMRASSGERYWLASLAGIHLFPTLIVFLGCLPLYAVATGARGFVLLDLVAFAVTAGAIGLEALSDEQLRRFRLAHADDPGSICSEGLWARSRHPNYLGEMGFWWGLWLFGVAARPDAFWWTLLGPLAVTLMFRFATIPMIDRRHLARRRGYEEHMQRVPVVPRLGS
jgi:steroid 5-alpha reductase family enzyme